MSAGLHMVGSGCGDCLDGACTMNCSTAQLVTGKEWIAASIWAGVFPAKATAEQVREWREAVACKWCNGAGWYESFSGGFAHEMPCEYCNPNGLSRAAIAKATGDAQ